MLGVPHPDYLLAILDSQQLNDWMAYYSLEPFGYFEEWHHTALLATLTANPWRAKGQVPYKPSDFMPALGVDAEEKMPSISQTQTPEEALSVLMPMIQESGGNIQKHTEASRAEAIRRREEARAMFAKARESLKNA